MNNIYRAIDIANYVINHCIEINRPISNLQLQKIMYYIQSSFVVNLDRLCFQEDIEAWPYGPVIPELYNEFYKFGADKINSYQNNIINLKREEIVIIDDMTDKYSDYNIFELVKITHAEDPWIKHHIGREVIPIEEIKEYFLTSEKNISKVSMG